MNRSRYVLNPTNGELVFTEPNNINANHVYVSVLINKGAILDIQLRQAIGDAFYNEDFGEWRIESKPFAYL